MLNAVLENPMSTMFRIYVGEFTKQRSERNKRTASVLVESKSETFRKNHKIGSRLKSHSNAVLENPNASNNHSNERREAPHVSRLSREQLI